MRSIRIRARWRLIGAAVAGLFLSACSAWASDEMQRMLIGTGCYRLAAHATGAVPAFCLDKAGTAPRRGAVLDQTPALGEATVSVGNQTMSLRTALARHLLRIEGSDTHRELSLVNLTGEPMSLCVGRPVVVMGNGMTYSADLRRIYDQIVQAAQAPDGPPSGPPSTEGDEAHERLQQRLWTLVNTEEERELSPWPLPGASLPDRDDCSAKADASVPEFVLCR